MKLMKSFPGGTLLIPMFIASFINTFFPDLFNIGGLTQSLFAGDGMNFLLASAVFLSGCSLNLKVIGKVFNRYGSLIIVRLLLNTIFGYLFVKTFNLSGVLGISAIAFICTLTSMNPTLFLAIISDYGDDVDQSAFGLIALVATPIVPMFIYGLTSPTSLDFMPIISTLIPLIAGVVIGNFDPQLGKHLSMAMGFIIVFLGWAVGTGINLLDAIKAGVPGLIMVVLYYLFSFLPVFLFEKKVLKKSGLGSIGMSNVAGISASIPLLMVVNNPELAPYTSQAASITTLAVILTAIISSALAKKMSENK